MTPGRQFIPILRRRMAPLVLCAALCAGLKAGTVSIDFNSSNGLFASLPGRPSPALVPELGASGSSGDGFLSITDSRPGLSPKAGNL